VVGEDDEVARFQHVMKMLYSLADGQQLTVVYAVFLLGRVEFPGLGTAGHSGRVAAAWHPWQTWRHL
jgi:hypothetical protein